VRSSNAKNDGTEPSVEAIVATLVKLVDQGAHDPVLLLEMSKHGSVESQLIILEMMHVWARVHFRWDINKRLDGLLDNLLDQQGFTKSLPRFVMDTQGQVCLQELTWLPLGIAVVSAQVSDERILLTYATTAPRISLPPGRRLLKFADFFSSAKSMELVFRPLVADWHHEYFDALNERREWKARWISIRNCWDFAKAFGLCKLLGLIKPILRK